ncbi:hypothetical protein HNQ93_001711 [Hymenobacter luteus]|uniref:Uncharacterized protein n=2 Tax=Hymenobacter TaxID=89966 RepID=A0A7W9WBW8_9BACT|nr:MULTISPECIES: hypothetical protein [Hymenobacter]MBB4600928.1 hypothetical protein [Hymenobacter latericoloratus]MBB6058865.1 hypothetical protein [Hymenobacter luteus]
MRFTSNSTLGVLVSQPTSEATAILVAQLSAGLTLEQAAAAPKLFQLSRQYGEDEIRKLLAVILRAFVDSVRVPDKPTPADVLDLADTLLQTYSHDSLRDIVLALKQARTGGTIFYQALDPATIYGLLRAYFERKATFLEQRHLDQKARSTSAEQNAVGRLQQAAPHLLAGIGRQLPPDHPNVEHLRQRLTLINLKEKRGLLPPDQAQQLRDETHAAAQRRPRPDWQPSPEAQQLIDARHRAEDRRLAEKYRPNPAA